MGIISWNKLSLHQRPLSHFHKRPLSHIGDSQAMAKIGGYFQYGIGLQSIDYDEALKWYRKAADAGNGPGMVALGNIYADGKGVKRDYTEAERWYRRAADAGEVHGIIN